MRHRGIVRPFMMGSGSPLVASKRTSPRSVILVVEDPDLASRLTSMVVLAGSRSIAAGTEELARVVAQEVRPVVIIGARDGLRAVGLVRRLRRLRPSAGIVICMDDVRWFDETFEAGADAWVSTKVQPDAVAAVLRTV